MPVTIPDPRWEMPELLTPGRKPTGNVVIDWSNSITRNMTGCCGVGSNPFVNLVNGKLPTSTLNATIVRNTIHLAAGYVAVSDFFADSDDNGFTVFGRITATGDRENDYMVGWGTTATNGGPHIGFTGLGAGSVPRIYMAVWGDGTFENTGGIEDSLVHSWVGTLDSDGSSGRMYIDGVQLASGTLNASALNTASGYIGALPNGNNPWTGDMLLVCSWNRRLSDSEIKSLHDDPYQFLIPA